MGWRLWQNLDATENVTGRDTLGGSTCISPPSRRSDSYRGEPPSGWLGSRAGLEADLLSKRVIGHIKTDGHLGRCRLKGRHDDAANAILTGVGHNLRLLL